MSKHYDWIVVGAGVIGSISAWRLQQRLGRVALVEADEPGGKATGAAAGILSPSAEAVDAGPFTTLLQASRKRYPAMVEELQDAVGMDVGYHPSGVVQIAAAPDEVSTLRKRLAWLDGVTWMDESDARPFGGLAAIYAAQEGQVHPPLLVKAAVKAGIAAGVEPYFGQPARLLLEHGRAVGVSLPSGTIYADAGLIVAAGAWSSIVTAHWSAPIPVEPIRGQIVSFATDRPLMPHIVFHGHQYLVPKRDGRLIVGATEDRAGFDARVTASGMVHLAQVVEGFNLSRDRLYLERVWAGLRPKTPDGLPILGPWPGLAGLYVATGHYRNGVLLSAVTADAVLAWAQGEPLPLDLAPFRPERLLAVRSADNG
ncbi:NAD(P)/FAD-dependent oxidoreductase [Sulfobacillus harzensis]|uniref:FAD-dependent oxidoreductase n=1 Tax=Sulfobacillus harzensis TaxID=2729629 RepID=A0A7Y0Q4Q7_9FIRM|nr:FAD-dependent oxidoreductase [Sulfobacillus harzensis]NMP24286.1 FAD-dependent oxidoreductase [Sulfobacillus harzensis]